MTPSNITDHLLTPAEAADFLRFSRAHLANLRYLGRGPKFVRLGGAVRYRGADLAAWVAENVSG